MYMLAYKSNISNTTKTHKRGNCIYTYFMFMCMCFSNNPCMHMFFFTVFIQMDICRRQYFNRIDVFKNILLNFRNNFTALVCVYLKFHQKIYSNISFFLSFFCFVYVSVYMYNIYIIYICIYTVFFCICVLIYLLSFHVHKLLYLLFNIKHSISDEGILCLFHLYEWRCVCYQSLS